MEKEIYRRKQFTFYESFYNCIEKTLKKKTEKLWAYRALIQYALYGSISDFEYIPDSVCGLLEAFYPILDTSREKAKNGVQGGKAKQSASTASPENESKNKNKNKIKNKYKEESKGNDADFERFWSVYPKQIGKEEARRAFDSVAEPVQTLIDAIIQQKQSPQWQKQDGQYIPNPATWLNGKRWTDHLSAPLSSTISEHEIQAIRRIISNPTLPT